MSDIDPAVAPEPRESEPSQTESAGTAVETDRELSPTDPSDLPLAEQDINEGAVTAPGAAVEGGDDDLA